MKTHEVRALLEQQGYSVTEQEIDAVDGKFWRVIVAKGTQNWGANGLAEQPLASAYQNLVVLLNKNNITHPNGQTIQPNDIEWPAP